VFTLSFCEVRIQVKHFPTTFANPSPEKPSSVTLLFESTYICECPQKWHMPNQNSTSQDLQSKELPSITSSGYLWLDRKAVLHTAIMASTLTLTYSST